MSDVVAGYDYAQPTEAGAVQALGALVGAAAAEPLWDLAARSLAVQRPVLSTDDLCRVADQLMQLGDLARIAGRSLRVRCITYDALSGSAEQ